MRKETYTLELETLLVATLGRHALMAKKAGIAQATISRMYLKKASPRLEHVELLLPVLRNEFRSMTKTSALRTPRNASSSRRVAAPASLSQ